MALSRTEGRLAIEFRFLFGKINSGQFIYVEKKLRPGGFLLWAKELLQELKTIHNGTMI